MRSRNVDEQKLESLIANLLRAGVVISAFVVLSGAVMYLGFHPWARVDYHTFHGEPDELKTVHGVIRHAFSGNARGIMQLGLLLLIATPIARRTASTRPMARTSGSRSRSTTSRRGGRSAW